MTPAKMASHIDHTLLRADATVRKIVELCTEARTHGFYALCINSKWLKLAVAELEGGQTIPITVVGFPLGATLSQSKAAETRYAIDLGAREIDMVMDIGAAKDGDWKTVGADIGQVVKAAHKTPVKVILENCYLSQAEIWEACRISRDSGAAFVKTSTGFGSSGAKIDDIRLMREAVGPEMGVKASGGIKTLADFMAMIEAGATRVGTSNSVQILKELA